MKFLLLILVVLLNSGINQILAGTAYLPPEAEIKQTKSADFENTWASGHAVLFSSNSSGEWGFNYRERLSESSTEEEHTIYGNPPHQNILRDLAGAIYLDASLVFEISQTSRKLLFPFHSFL